MDMFSRPHSSATDTFADIPVDFELLRALPTWDALAELLDAEVAAVYGRPRTASRVEYCTLRQPGVFANTLHAAIFATLRTHDATMAEAAALRAEHETIEAARPPPPPKAAPKLDENGDEIPPPPKSRRVLREEAEQKKRDAARLATLLKTEHAVACLAVRLANVFALHSLRVYF